MIDGSGDGLGLNNVCSSLSEVEYKSKEIELDNYPPYQYPNPIDLIYPYKYIELFYSYIKNPKDTNLNILSNQQLEDSISNATDTGWNPDDEVWDQ